MLHRFLRLLVFTAILAVLSVQMNAAGCADVYPQILGPQSVREGQTVTYFAPLVAGHTYLWSLPDGGGALGATSSDANYTYQTITWSTLNPAQDFRVQLKETFTCFVVTFITVHVNPQIHAYFYYQSPLGKCYDNVVSFTGSTSFSTDPSDPITSYTWDFNDGTGTVTTANTLHTFPGPFPQTFTVTLTVSDARGFTDVITDYVFVDPNRYQASAVIDPPVLPNCLYTAVPFVGSNSLAKPASSTATIDMYSYTWNFGDGTGDTVILWPSSPNKSHTYLTWGTYRVKLTVQNTYNCKNTDSVDVVIQNTLPVAGFINDPPCLGISTQFHDASTTPIGTITNWSWNFDDPTGTGNIITGNANPTHTYNTAKGYYPSITVTNSNGCSSTFKLTTPLIVAPSPVANFDYTSACNGEAVHFTNTSTTSGGTAITGYEWDINGEVKTTKDIDYTFPAAATYPVTLIITNANGCKNQKTVSVVVNPPPDVDFTFNGTIVNYQFIFTAIVNPAQHVSNNLTWEFGDGSGPAHGSTATHTFPGAGTFTVRVTGTDMVTGCSNYKEQQVTAGAPPSAFFTASPADQCEGLPVSFTAGPPGGLITAEHWDYHDGTTQDFVSGTLCCPANPTHIFVAPGNVGPYHVTRVVNPGTASEATWDVYGTIYPKPTAQFIWFSDATETWQGRTCADQAVYFKDVSFSNTTPAGNIYKWNWDFGDPGSGGSNNSTQQNPTHIFSGSNQTYQVRLTVTDNVNDCQDTTSLINVFISAPIPVEFTYNDFTCLDQLVNFAPVGLTPYSDYTWLWDFGDGSPTSNTPGAVSHLFPSVGTWTVSLSLTDKYGCSKTKQHTLTIIPLPIANFTFTSSTCEGKPIQFTDQSVPASGYPDIITQWNWNFGDGIGTSTLQNPSYTYPGYNPAGYDVILTVTTSRGCVSTKTLHVQPIPAPTANFEVLPQTPTCATQLVQFHDLSQVHGGGALVTWNWNFGDPGSGSNNIATGQNATHVFATAGIYGVTLKVTNANGCDKDTTIQVTINPLPVADFLVTDNCEGDITVFTDNSSTLPAGTTFNSYSWDFGDGATSNIQNPQHTYAVYGTKTVTLTVVNSNGCISSVQKQVNIFAKPLAEFIYSAASCIGNPVNYTDQSHVPSGFSGYINKWVWDFGDGTSQTINFPASPNVSHTFIGGANSHIVRLTVTTTSGCTGFIEHTITSIPSPLANFTYSNSNCIGQIMQFTDLTSTNGGPSLQTWLWTFGDPNSGASNTSTLKNPPHSFVTIGAHLVTLVVSSVNGCTSTYDTTIDIKALPVSNFTYTTACEGSSTQFTDASTSNATSIITYLWDFGDGSATSNLQNPLHLYAGYGVKSVHLTVTNDNGCIKDTTKQVLVNPKPLPEFTFTNPNCVGAAIQYTDQSTTVTGYLGSIATWQWDFGDGSVIAPIHFPASPNITHTFLGNATSYTVTLTDTTTTGCVAHISHVVTLVPSPLCNFSFPTSTCAQQSIQFNDLSQPNGGGNILTWHWDFGDPSSGSGNIALTKNPIHLFSGPGTYHVVLNVTNASNCPGTKDTTVTIIALPTSNFRADTACLGSVTTFTDMSVATGTITQYSWNFGDGGTAITANPTHLYGLAGVYSVTLTVTTNEGCVKDTTRNVLVLAKPIASFQTSAPACAGDMIQFTDLSTTPHGSIRTWLWDFGDGTTQTITFPTSPNVQHTYANGGTYSVHLKITTSDNCISEKIIDVLISASPIANFMAGTTHCALMPIPFTDLSQANGGAAITQWHWDFGDPNSGSANISTTKNPSHNFTGGANFTVRLTVTSSSGCVNDTSQVISVNAAPLAKFSSDTACAGTLTHFTDASVPNATGPISAWVWTFGDPASGVSNTSTLQNPTHQFSGVGTFMVDLRVTNSNSCIKDTIVPVVVNPKPTAMFKADAACVGDSTSFQDLSIAPGSQIDTWAWNFGDGGSASIQNPKHAFASSGNFNVTLTVTNLAGCLDSISISVTARPKPVSAFTYTSYFCPKGMVNFEDQSQGTGSAITDRYWIFQPGYTSTLPNPSYTFPATDTTYLVSLIVTDNFGCKDTITDSVHVKPGFKFTFTNDTVCYKNLTHFTAVNQARGDTLYNPRWDFGDPASGPANYDNVYSPSHLFSAPGVYAVKLRVVDSDNCTDSIYHNITVYDLPKPLFSFVSLPCDSVIRFTDLSLAGSGSIASWIWDYGDGSPFDTILAPGPGDTSHLYHSMSSFHVVLQVHNSNGCVDTLSQLVSSYPCIMASYAYDTLLMCANYPIAFADSSLPVNRINQWHWIFGDGNDTIYSAHTSNVTHTFANGGTYAVKLIIDATVSGRTFIDTVTKMVLIHPTPLTQFANKAVCLDQITLFTDTTKTYGAKISSWKWNFGEPTSGVKDTSSVKDPTHKYDTAGVYNVKLVVMNKFGCKDSLTKSTRIFAIPTAHFNSSIACSGNPTYFTDKSVIADTTIGEWHWNFGEISSRKDSSLVQDPSHQYKTDGTYNVKMIIKDKNGCYDTADSSVVVHVTPTSAFTVTEKVNNMIGKIKLNNLTEDADTYYWDFGDPAIPTSTDENPIVTYSHDGTYLIMLVSSNSFQCSDTTYFKYEVLFKGLYIPNAFAPSSGLLGVSVFHPVGVNLKTYLIEVFDNWGHLMWQSKLLDTDGHPIDSWDGKDLNGNPAPSATYMWKVSATFIDGSLWEGSDIGVGDFKTVGTVTLIR